MTTEPLIRITSFIHRKSTISADDFYRYWTQVHGPLVHSFMLRHGVIEYKQFHTTAATKSFAAGMAEQSGRPLMEYDGMTDAYVRDWKTWEEAFTDPEYLEKIKPDEEAFIDVGRLRMTVGYDWEVLREGKVCDCSR
ncbi:EthD domain-containing protein [Dendryphion nanum]|uniref:EthD domain-containing protein n=1 Tax=Dendryphion nanum TaxID=256645 RepID=A0A9P9IRF9_9PLEO|nr:EthD domain-containing protein [Dendryphion nanum]